MVSIDYFTVIKKLLPTSERLFDGKNFNGLIEGISVEFGRVHNSVVQFFTKEVPFTLNAGLAEWEEILNIQNVGLSEKQRNLEVVGKLSAVAGQSKKFWLDYLRRISSRDIDIEFYSRTKVGISVGSRLYGPEWAFSLKIKNVRPDDLLIIKNNVEKFLHAHLSAIYEVKNGED